MIVKPTRFMRTLQRVSCALLGLYCINSFSQIDRNQDAPAYYQKCLRDGQLINPEVCTEQEVMRVVIGYLTGAGERLGGLKVVLFMNERGSLIDVVVSNNDEACARHVKERLMGSSFFPARKNGAFTASTLTYYIDENTIARYTPERDIGAPMLPVYELRPVLTVPEKGDLYDATIPFAVIDETPSTEKCATHATNGEKKACFSMFAHQFVKKKLGKKFEDFMQTPNGRLIILCTINEQGIVTDVKVRTTDTALEKQVLKVMKRFPELSPGKHRGKVVKTTFALLFKS